MSNLTNVRLVPPSPAQSQNPQAGVRAVPLSPSSPAQSRPTGDKFGDKAGLTPTMRAGEPQRPASTLVQRQEGSSSLSARCPARRLRRMEAWADFAFTAVGVNERMATVLRYIQFGMTRAL